MITASKAKELKTKLLNKVANKLKANPQLHKQRCWVIVKKENPYTGRKKNHNISEICQLTNKYQCNTPGCFAGHVAYEANYNFKPLLEHHRIDEYDTLEEATKRIIGYSDSFSDFIVSGHAFGKKNKINQTNTYIEILKMFAAGKSEMFVSAWILENKKDLLDNEDIITVKECLTNAV